ncbi:MAG: hypothetical protein ACPL0C_04085 [Candidatus Bathyarchaeales archaeon]
MTEDRNNYSDYVKHLSNLMSGMLFLAGFTFTVVTILLTRLSNPNTVQSQLILLFFTVFFYLLIFLASHFAIEVIYYCEGVPQLSIQTKITNALVVLVILSVGFAFPLLFLLWELTSLATISCVIWMFFAVAIFLFVYMPFQKWRRIH